jgi:hypothetical protein
MRKERAQSTSHWQHDKSAVSPYFRRRISSALEAQLVFPVEICVPDFQFLQRQAFQFPTWLDRQAEKFLQTLNPPNPETF